MRHSRNETSPGLTSGARVALTSSLVVARVVTRPACIAPSGLLVKPRLRRRSVAEVRREAAAH
jgi:hypothetical protein